MDTIQQLWTDYLMWISYLPILNSSFRPYMHQEVWMPTANHLFLAQYSDSYWNISRIWWLYGISVLCSVWLCNSLVSDTWIKVNLERMATKLETRHMWWSIHVHACTCSWVGTSSTTFEGKGVREHKSDIRDTGRDYGMVSDTDIGYRSREVDTVTTWQKYKDSEILN